MLATTNPQPGQLLTSEAPLFTTESLTNEPTIENGLGAIVRSLPKESQRAFLSLHNNNPGPKPFSKFIRSNRYPLGPSSDMECILPVVARINHFCLPNAQHAWNGKRLMQVHIVRDIPEGQKITLSYTTGGPSDAGEDVGKVFWLLLRLLAVQLIRG